MVSRFEVELCYRFILGRNPESTDVVDKLCRQFENFGDLQKSFINSDELRRKISVLNVLPTQPLNWPPIAVDVIVPPHYLNEMLSRVERSWQELGELEPFWSVLTEDDFRSENIDTNKTRFYESGRQGVDYFIASAARAGITDFSSMPVCLEYGCGVGRLTTWLAQRFNRVIGCDISQPHLDYAKVALAEREIDNVELLRVPTVSEIDNLPSFDVFFSIIVLQHNPPPISAHILEKVLLKLNPGGLAYFQIPTYRLDYRFDARAYVEGEDRLEMEMHAVPQHELFALFARCGCKILEVREDSWTGSQIFVSNSFLLRK